MPPQVERVGRREGDRFRPSGGADTAVCQESGGATIGPYTGQISRKRPLHAGPVWNRAWRTHRGFGRSRSLRIDREPVRVVEELREMESDSIESTDSPDEDLSAACADSDLF